MASLVIEANGLGKSFQLDLLRPTTAKARVLSRLAGARRTPMQLQAVQEVSFTLAAGESLAVLGSNGSGKSTLLQMLASIVKPSSGSLATRGRVAPLLELGAGFHPELTGRSNVFLSLSLMGQSNSRTRQLFKEIEEFAGLGDFIDVPVKLYSTGMFVRLGFATAIHSNPAILLADEVLAVGDASFRKRCLDRVRSLQSSGMALVLVTHDLVQAEQFCDRFIRLEAGRCVEEGRFR